MPIYKGAVEVTSGNLYKGSTEIENGYKGSDSIFINETTLTIAFVDNTATGSSLNSTTSVSFTGSPGTSFSSFSRSVNRTNGTYAVTGATVSEVGDPSGNVNTSVSGSGNVSRSISISGTIPTITKTVTLTVDSTVNTLLSRNMTIGSRTSPTSYKSSYTGFQGMSFSGGGNASFCVPAVAGGGGSYGGQWNIDGGSQGTVQSACRGGVCMGLTSGNNPSIMLFGCDSGINGNQTTTVSMSIGETSTYQSGSSSITFTWY